MAAALTPPPGEVHADTPADVVLVTKDGRVVEVRFEGAAPGSRRPAGAVTADRDALLDALLREQTPEQERDRLIAARARAVTAALGGVRATARALRVAPSQVSRWSSGEARPRAEHARRLLDLDHVIAQAHLLWDGDELVRDWLTSYNGFLGARPIDVTILQGSGPVVDAIRAELSGAYA